MSNQNSSKELREKIMALKPSNADQLPLGALLSIKELDAVMEVLESYIAQQVADARIGENRRWLSIYRLLLKEFKARTPDYESRTEKALQLNIEQHELRIKELESLKKDKE